MHNPDLELTTCSAIANAFTAIFAEFGESAQIRLSGLPTGGGSEAILLTEEDLGQIKAGCHSGVRSMLSRCGFVRASPHFRSAV